MFLLNSFVRTLSEKIKTLKRKKQKKFHFLFVRISPSDIVRKNQEPPNFSYCPKIPQTFIQNRFSFSTKDSTLLFS